MLSNNKQPKDQFQSSAIERILYGKTIAEIAREKQPSKDHKKDNLRNIKDIQRKKKQQEEQERRKQEEERKKKEETKRRFSYVTPRVYTPNMTRSNSSLSLDSEFDRMSISTSITNSTSSKPPKYLSSQNVFVPPSGRKLSLGQIPKYLVDRKIKLIEEEERKREEQIKQKTGYKDGMRLMTEEERTLKIDKLAKDLEAAHKKLKRIQHPIRTRADYDLKVNTEEEINAIEKELDALSKQKLVWLPIDQSPLCNSEIQSAIIGETDEECIYRLT